MENQSRFDLNDALLQWRGDLLGQPGIATEDIRELETHLLQGFSVLRQRGLTDEEAFAEARKRLGLPAEMGAEFAKANLQRVWRDRVFWISFLSFIMALYSAVAGESLMRLAHRLDGSVSAPFWVLTVSFLAGLPGLLLCAFLASGRAELFFRKSSWMFSQRWRLGMVSALAIIAAKLLTHRTWGGWLVPVLCFLGFAIVVMPREIMAASALQRRTTEDWRNSILVWRDRLFWLLLAHLAISAWTVLVSIGANTYFLRLSETQPVALTIIASLLFFLIWLGPMGVVGLALRTGRLSIISRALSSRGQVGFITGVLTLISVGVKFWFSTWKISSTRISAATWKFNLVFDTWCSFLIGAVFIAVMVWLSRDGASDRPLSKSN